MSFLNYSNKTFFLKGKISIYKVSEIKRKIIENYYLEENKAVAFYLDLSEIESIDVSVFQLILAFKNSVEANKGTLEITKSSQAFDALMDLLGLSVGLFSKAA